MESEQSVRKFSYKDFTNKKVLGEGSFNQVYYAEHQELGNCVLKIVTRTFFAKAKQKIQLEDEAKSMFDLKHENIIKGYGIIMEPEHLCLVYEFASYGCLSDALRRISIPWSVKIRAAYQTVLALSYLHSRPEPVVHRNLKATNILLTEDFSIKVSDIVLPQSTMWISQATKQKEITERKYTLEGKKVDRKGSSLAHIPPEIIQNLHALVLPSYDMYSFGVILWEILSHIKPFENDSPESVYKKVTGGYEFPHNVILKDRPQLLFDLMNQALRKLPDERPSFKDAYDMLKPLHDSSTDNALKDTLRCKTDYESYRTLKKLKRASQKGNKHDQTPANKTSPIRSISHDPNIPCVRTTPIRCTSEEYKTEPNVLSPRHCFSSSFSPKDDIKEEQEDNDCPMKTPLASPYEEDWNLKQPEMTNKLEKTFETTLDDPSKPTISDEKERSEAFTDHNDLGSAKAFPFMDEPVDEQNDANRGARQRSARGTTQFFFQGGNINLHVGDNVAHTSSDAIPENIQPSPDSYDYPARNSQRECKTTDFYKVIDNIPSKKWKYLARFTGLNESNIDAIDYDYDRDGIQEKIYQVLFRWKSSRSYHTVGDLVQLLLNVKLYAAASKVEP